MNNENELLIEIQKRHGVKLSSDDPILIMETLNKSLINANREAQQALLAQYKSEIEEISARWSTDNINRAENILNAALLANKQAIDNQIQKSIKNSTQPLQETFDHFEKNKTSFLMQMKTLTYINIFAVLIMAMIALAEKLIP